ncbi:hypothetical protein MKQ68_12655 [Chitinophaga horti]|uniref:DUF6249 domain-containing protein n=1 Tax=Chitinophaga horti TaxID=2920382 RepID=A0ABY6JCD6_9BACT|nr:DUF6249 domain-containing protein [Chitinophaga horti]UYQ95951.1 hypothetical protein MKQ68_12655 [Chitinophaga horti]
MEIRDLFSLLCFTSCILIFLAWFFSHTARHKERLLMIEKGMNPDAEGSARPNARKALFKLAVVVIGLSIGLALIGILAEFERLGRSGAIPISILGLCGGIALIIANHLSKPKN